MLCEHGGGYLSQAEEEKKSEALQRSPQGVLNDLQSMTLGRREKSLPGKRNSVCSVACKRHGTFREIQLVNMSGVQKTCRKESKDQVGDWLSGGQLSKSYFPY